MNTAQHGYGGVWTAVVPSGGSVTVTMGSALAVSTAQPALAASGSAIAAPAALAVTTAQPGPAVTGSAAVTMLVATAPGRCRSPQRAPASPSRWPRRMSSPPARQSSCQVYGGRFCYRHPATRCRQHQHPRPRGPAGPGTRPGRTRRRGLVPGPGRFGLGHRHHGLGAGRHDGAAGRWSGRTRPSPWGPAGRRHDPACPGRLGRIVVTMGSALAVTTARPAVTASGSAGVSPAPWPWPWRSRPGGVWRHHHRPRCPGRDDCAARPGGVRVRCRGPAGPDRHCRAAAPFGHHDRLRRRHHERRTGSRDRRALQRRGLQRLHHPGCR